MSEFGEPPPAPEEEQQLAAAAAAAGGGAAAAAVGAAQAAQQVRGPALRAFVLCAGQLEGLHSPQVPLASKQ